MKFNYTFFLISILIFFSCGKEEPAKIETFSTEAFAFYLGNSWEVNATTRVKGFSQTEEENHFFATVSYDIDLITTDGDTLKSLISKVEDRKDSERINEIALEAQFDLDSTYTPGDYTVIFNIQDPGTQQTTTSSAGFKLSND